MLVFLTGNDPRLAKQNLDLIKRRYLEKNPDGAELIEWDEATSEPGWTDLAAVPLFTTTRLFIIRRLGDFPASEQAKLAPFLTNLPPTTVVAAWDRKPVAQGPLADALARADKVINVMTPVGPHLAKWITKRAAALNLELSAGQLSVLADPPPHDLWEVETALQQLACGPMAAERRKTTSEPFIFFQALRRRDWPRVKVELVKKNEIGEPIELTLGSLAAAIRKEVRGMAEQRALLGFLLDVDLGLKTGQLSSSDATALLVSHLPQPRSDRVQWEATWGEIQS
jgi:hypothetical protein